MRNAHARSDDYFSFMEERKGGKNPQNIRGAVFATDSFTDSDIIEFIPEPQIEVTESVVSDTMIQRIFGHFRLNLPAALED